MYVYIAGRAVGFIQDVGFEVMGKTLAGRWAVVVQLPMLRFSTKMVLGATGSCSAGKEVDSKLRFYFSSCDKDFERLDGTMSCGIQSCFFPEHAMFSVSNVIFLQTFRSCIIVISDISIHRCLVSFHTFGATFNSTSSLSDPTSRQICCVCWYICQWQHMQVQ